MTGAIVTDIEGTTSSLSFVKDVLFPYARMHLVEFVRRHAQESAVREQLAAVSKEVGRKLRDEEAAQQLLRWIDEDKKITPLKALQGLIWEAGYRRGDFQGHVYDDAVQYLRAWKAQGWLLYVFSSGSVHAQKLLFEHTAYGDLTPLFSGYFDTNIGSKRESAAYRHIAQAIQLPPAQILFLSDIREELDAALTVGFKTCWLVRDGDMPKNSPHALAKDFAQIVLPS